MSRTHSQDKRIWDAAGEDDGATDTLPKRPRLAGAVLNQLGHAGVKLSHDSYTVGWVCALPLEMAAAKAMLDDTHQLLDMNPNDSNVYTFGHIGAHNVVIACLPSGQYGTNSAAVVANNMRWSFPSIHIGLMVGIGGGVPGKVDIRLGDVVVSNPTADCPGVVQYDFGKAVKDGRFERTGTLNKPPQSVLTAVAMLRANHEARPNQIPAILQDMEMRNPYMSDYFYQSVDEDRLFEATYEHTAGDSCDKCDTSKVVDRVPRLAADTPMIHYGIIASGNQVMKHAQTRDRLAKEMGLICFEMEAAGLMNNFPCLVVRGICDYSDSHKAKQWQRYAAATAAAYTRELLYVITPHVTRTVVPHGNHLSATQTAVPDTARSPPLDHRKILLDSLKFDQIDKRQANIKAAHAKTCEWLTKHPDYTTWMDRQKYFQHHGFLWIRGKPGAGKSTLMKFAFLREKRRRGTRGTLISFFFNARGADLEKTTVGMYRSLVHQLLSNLADLQELLDDPDLRPLTQPDADIWDLNQLKSLFCNAIRRLGQRQLTCFIDALDECDDNDVSDMVKCFEDLGQYSVQNDIRFYVCFSSRHYPYIDILYGQKLILEEQDGHGKDLADYVRSKLRAGSGPKSEQVIAEILRKASGVFMWVVLVVDILNKEYGKGRLFAVEKRLKDIPSELSKLFQDILTRDQEDMRDLLLCIQLLLYSQRPLKQEEYYFAIASGLEPDTLGEWNPEDVPLDYMDRLIVSSSKGLAETTRSDDRTVQFIHESVRDFLLKDNGLRDLWPDMGDSFEGRSYDRLKDCCHTYLTQINILAYLPEDEFLLRTSKEDAQSLKGKVAERFPFLEYAATQVLYHAESAATHGIPQDNFVRSFAVDHWIQMNNLFTRYATRRHKPTSTSLLYIAAEKGLTKLVKMVSRWYPTVDIPGGRYNYPLNAAMIQGHEDTANVLLDRIGKSLRQNEHDPSSGLELRRSSCHVSPSLDCKDDQHRTPLYYAVQKQNIGIAQKLLELGANPSFHMKRVSASPLVLAAENGNEALVRLILHERTRFQSSPTAVGGKSSLVSSNEEHDGEKRLWKLDEHDILSAGNDSQTLAPAIRTCDEDVSEALLVVAKTGKEEFARLLVHFGADIHYVDSFDDTPLHLACQHGQEKRAKLLLEAGADVNRKGWVGRTPLHHASNVAIVKLLVENGADLESISPNDRAALHRACVDGNLAVAAELLKAGANLHARDKQGKTPLHFACNHGNLAIVEALLEAGANLQARDEDGNTPLHFACRMDRLETATCLIEAGADVQATDKDGKTPLFYAVQHRQMSCLDLLLDHGADINHRDNRGQTPVFEVIYNHGNNVQKFLDKQPDLEITDHSGQTALFELYTWNSKVTHSAKLLVEAGMDTARRNRIGQTFLHVACLKNAMKNVMSDEYLNFARWVLEQGFEVNARDDTGRTPLLEAVKGCQTRFIPLLIQYGANPDAADDQGWTPLSTAIDIEESIYQNCKSLDLVQLLLENGADATKAGPNGEGLLDMAARLGRDNLLGPLKASRGDRRII